MPPKNLKLRKLKNKRSYATEPPALARMAALLEAGHGKEKDVEAYYWHYYTWRLALLQSIVARAESGRNWNSMRGCYKQAAELYVLASVLYENHPNHVMMTDGAYDGLAQWLLKHWKDLPYDFKLWYNITSIDLQAGTGHKVVEQQPIRWMLRIILGSKLHVESTSTKKKTVRGRTVGKAKLPKTNKGALQRSRKRRRNSRSKGGE